MLAGLCVIARAPSCLDRTREAALLAKECGLFYELARATIWQRGLAARGHGGVAYRLALINRLSAQQVPGG
jgi:hypothetical protein